MMRQRGFALFDVLLAVILMTIAAAGSYTLVKSFRVNSAAQQVMRYATTITQSFVPFLDGGNSANVLQDQKLASSFLSAIGITTTDQVTESGAACAGDSAFCYVDSGMYTGDGKSLMSFNSVTDNTQKLASYFAIALLATGAQVNQILQSASSLFSVYCGEKNTNLNTLSSNCSLKDKDSANEIYSLFLVFPKTSTSVAIDLKPMAGITA